MDFGFLKNLFPDGQGASFGPPSPDQSSSPTTPMSPPQTSQQPIQAAAAPNLSGFTPTQAPAPQLQGQGLLGGLQAPQFNKQTMQAVGKALGPQPGQPAAPQAQASTQLPTLQSMNLGPRMDPSQYLR